MVVCRFFLEGNCRYGESCKFEHDKGGGQWNYPAQQSYSSPLNLSSNPKPAQPVSNVETTTLVKSAINDMTLAEKGGQWLLSSYAPFKERPEFPGFEDYCFEEIRLMYYEAMKNGLVEQYKQQWQNILQQAMMRVKALQNPTPDIAKVLENIYNTPQKTATPLNSSGIFGGNQQPAPSNAAPYPNIFGSASTSNNIFTQNQPNPSNLQQPSGGSIFGSTTGNTGLFSGGAKQQAFSGSVFSGAPQNPQSSQSSNIFNKQQNVFTGNVENKNPFGAVQPTNSVFGSPQVNGSNVFGNSQSNSLFAGQQNQGSAFGTPPANVFNQQQQPNVFNQQQPNVFNQQAPQQSNVFSGNTQLDSSNIFASQKPIGTMFSGQTNQQQPNNSPLFSQQPQQNVNSNSSNLFQHQATGGENSNQFFQSPLQNTNNSNSGNSVFSSTANTVLQNNMNNPALEISSSAYSKLEDLSEAEINWFQSDDLDMENIPIKPPTREMCI